MRRILGLMTGVKASFADIANLAPHTSAFDSADGSVLHRSKLRGAPAWPLTCSYRLAIMLLLGFTADSKLCIIARYGLPV
jgi:hypothetical protein